MAFSPDGRTLAWADNSVSLDPTVRLLDVPSRSAIGRPISSMGEDTHPETMAGLAFNGRTLVSLSNTYALRLAPNLLWRDYSELRSEICSRVGDGLSKTEWARDAPNVPYHEGCQ